MSKRPAEDEQRASVKLANVAQLEPTKDPKEGPTEGPVDQPDQPKQPDVDVAALTTWLEQWMKIHVAPEAWKEEFDIHNLLEDISDHVGDFFEGTFEEFLSALKTEQSISMSEDTLQEKFFDAHVDYIHCIALNEFLANNFRLNFRNKRRITEFSNRIEESASVDQLQFDMLYDLATFIASNGVEESEELSSEEEPVEESESSEEEESEEEESEEEESEEESE